MAMFGSGLATFIPSIPDEEDALQIKSEVKGKGGSLNDLPDECLIPILKRVPLKYMDEVSVVCQRWDNVIRENIGLEIWTTDIGFRFGHRFFDELKDFSKFTIGILVSRVVTEIVPPLKDPEALFHLEIASQITVENFHTLTNKTINLKELHFGYSSLTLEDFSRVEMNFPNLQILNIADRAFECREIEGPENMTKNILGLMQKKFPALITFTLNTVATRKISKRYGIQLLKFVQAHSLTLKNLNVSITTAIQRVPLEDYGSLDHTIALENDDLMDLNWKELQKVRFGKLSLDFGSKFFVGMDEWRRILNNQDKLTEVTFALTKPLPNNVILPAISLSLSSLVTIEIGLEIYKKDEPKTPLDCSLFEPCENLKKLLILGSPMSEDRPVSKEIFNTQNLPKSLSSFGVENMFMERNEVENIFWLLPEIRKISLLNIGCTDDYGMTLPLLSKILNTFQLIEITVKGINGDESELQQYDQLIQLGLKLPLPQALFHVTFFSHYKRYCPAV